MGDRAIWTRRRVMQTGGALGALALLDPLLPAYARAGQGASSPKAAPARRLEDGTTLLELTIAETALQLAGRRADAVTINGTVPGPLLRFREGETAVIRVTNRLEEDTSIHWHGILLPPEMDGVPGVSFPGIRPGETFEYRFQLKQHGTYWYHSHSGLQEQLGHYGPLVVEPREGTTPYGYDREYFVVLADWTFENPYRVLSRLKKNGDYYNFQKRTVADLFADIGSKGLGATLRERWMWASMRMEQTDILDVTGATYTYLMNGVAPQDNWTGLFTPGERVLLHFINAGANTFFDVRIPGLPLTVVQSNGQYVQPVETDEFRIAIAETYSVIVEPKEERAYTIFAESMDRSGYTRGTLAPRPGMSAELPPRRKRPLLTMEDMGMAHGEGHGGHDAAPAEAPTEAPAGDHSGHGAAPPPQDAHQGHSGHEGPRPGGVTPPPSDAVKVATAGAIRTEGLRPPGTLPSQTSHDRDRHGPGNAAIPDLVKSRLSEPGIGLGEDPWRVLVYSDLRALERRPDFRAPTRELELHLTGNMERFMWSIDGVPFEHAEPVKLTFGERLRLTMVNDTMMNHPMHLHGMWMELENGHGELIPRVHTINVKPAERLSLLINVDAPGRWAFHCHILYHMEVGMFRVVEVSKAEHDGGHHGH